MLAAPQQNGTQEAKQRSVSSPIASTSTHFDPRPSLDDRPAPTSSRTGRRPSYNRAGRSSSAPLLSSTLQPHEFPIVENDDKAHHTFDTAKHAGPASLKRIFIGPHSVGSGAAGKRASTRQASGADDMETESSDSSDGSGETTSEQEDEGRRQRLKNKVAKRTKRRGDRLASGSTVATAPGKDSMQKWTGGSFEVGGDIREAAKRREEAAKRKAKTIRDLSTKSGVTTGAGTTNAQASSFVTARTHPDATKSAQPSMNGKPKPNGEYKLNPPPPEIETSHPALTHALLRAPSHLPDEHASVNLPTTLEPPSQLNPKSILRTATHSALGNGFPANRATYLNGNVKPSGAKSVQLPTTQNSSSWSSRVDVASTTGYGPPAPAGEVLARPGDKAGVLDEDAIRSGFEEALKKRPGKNAVLKKDRMLVRAEWTARDDLPEGFNEDTARKFPTKSDPWEEYAVVWRPRRLELWTEYALSATSLFVRHKKLAHVIPLNPARTKLSLYSSPDVIFCLAHRPTPVSFTSSATTRRQEKGTPKTTKATTKHHFRREGTNLYILRPRSIKVAKEWMWELFVELGGSIPPFIEVVVPGLGARLHVPLPAENDLPLTLTAPKSARLAKQGYQAAVFDEPSGDRPKYDLSPKSFVAICKQHLSNVTEWKELFAHAEEEGIDLKLAWRRGHVLDWVGTDKESRDWSVLGGLAMGQPGLDLVLELRPALHYPTTCRVPSKPNEPSKRLSEPPAIEGYLQRFRPNGKVERVYLSSHDGHLFLCRPSSAHPPEPPLPVHEGINNPAAIVLAPFILGFASMGKPKEREHLWERMSGRQSRKASRRNDDIINSIDHAEEIESVLEAFEKEERKRIYQQIMAARGYLDLVSVEHVKVAEAKEGDKVLTELDDLGGEEGLAATSDKDLLKRHRSFVMRTKLGMDVRFECYSIAVALEWVGRLNALITYWSRRERVDAIEQMELHPSLSKRSHPGETNDLDELDAPSPLLAKIYNFCVLEGCRTILRQGRFYVRKGARGMFKERLVFLLPGIVLEYQTKKRDIHGQPTGTVYHQRKSAFSLRGCYIYSGRLAASVLGPTGGSGWDPADDRPRFPRMYTARDGLRTTDDEEDCTLVIFKKTNETKGLGKKGKITVFRARSKVERDEWLFALNAAIERLHRSEQEREDRLREFPWLKNTH